MTAPSNSHPRDKAHLPTLATLFAAPAAWVTQMSADNIATSHSCYPQDTALPQPLWPGLTVFLVVVGAIALLIGIWATWSAYRDWQKDKARDSTTGTGAARFLAWLSLLSGSIFTTAIVFTLFANLLIPPCRPWF